MASEKQFDLEEYIEEVCKEAGVDPNDDVLKDIYEPLRINSKGGEPIVSKKKIFEFKLSYKLLLEIVIHQNWDPGCSSNFKQLLNNPMTELNFLDGIMPRPLLLRYLLFVKKYFRYGLFISNVILAIDLYMELEAVSDSEFAVLISGETGTGKEIVARIIHENSRRSKRPFIAINCSGYTDELLRSEIFGHIKGAFTGATSDHDGLIKAAEGGTLFLDEIGDAGIGFQKSLLRFLNDKSYTRVGDVETHYANVRILSASHQFFNAAMKGEKPDFREDLLYRLNKQTITLQPLRFVRSNIPLIIYLYANRIKHIHGYSDPIMISSIKLGDWFVINRFEGNYRQLINEVEDYTYRYIALLRDKKLHDIKPYYQIAPIDTNYDDIENLKKIPVILTECSEFDIGMQCVPDEFYIRHSTLSQSKISKELLAEFQTQGPPMYIQSPKDDPLDEIIFMPILFASLFQLSSIKSLNTEPILSFDNIGGNQPLYPFGAILKIIEAYNLKSENSNSAIKFDSISTLASQNTTIDELNKKYLEEYFRLNPGKSKHGYAVSLGFKKEKTLSTVLKKVGLDWPEKQIDSPKKPK